MNIMIAGGSGFLGSALTKSFLADGHKVYILTRGSAVTSGAEAVKWDAKTTSGWGHLVNEIDVVIHLAGRTLASWPWTASTKRDFRAVLRHIAYTGGWKKFDALWELVIRAKRVAALSPMLEALLEGQRSAAPASFRGGVDREQLDWSA